MSVIEKVVKAVKPMENYQDRAKARLKARAAALPGDWLSLILDHHVAVEAAFGAAKSARGAEARIAAQKKLGILLVAHAGAEETVVYPAMAVDGESGHARTGYDEQAAVKREMAQLEAIDPTSEEHAEKLEKIREAVAHHMYEEEGTWFPYLKKNALPSDQSKITARYKEEYERYVGRDG